MNGGDITSSRGAALDIYTGASNVKVEINKGSLEAKADNTFGIRGSENVVVDIKGGEILSQTNRLAIYVSGSKDNAIKLNISGGSIQNEGQAIQAYSGAVVNVSGSANIHSGDWHCYFHSERIWRSGIKHFRRKHQHRGQNWICSAGAGRKQGQYQRRHD